MTNICAANSVRQPPNERFTREDGVVYRNGEVYRDIIDSATGRCLDSQLIRTNHAKVMYDCPAELIE